MKNVDIISKVVARKGEAIASPSKDAAPVNLSGYLLKSIWDKCWEIRTTDKGEEYLFGKLPVGLQFDLSSFVDGGLIDLPTLYDGLPIDGQTLKWKEVTNEDGSVTRVLESVGGGGGTAEKVTWANIEGKPTWIGDSKPSYSWTEITGKPSWIGSSKPSYSWSEITGKPNFVTEEALDEEGFLTAMDIQVLTFTSGTFNAVSYDPSIAPKTVNIPTKLSHLEDDSDFVTLGMMSSYATKTWVGQQGFLDSSDLNGYATEKWVGQQGFLDSSDLNGYATETWVGNNYLSLTGSLPSSMNGEFKLQGDLRLMDGTESYGRRIIFGDVRTSNGQPYVYIGEDTDDDLTIASWGDFRIKVGDGAYLTYIKDDGYWEITGDLLVTGGITSYE